MIRRAIEQDVEQILVELRAFASFYGTKRSLFPKEPQVARSVVQKLVADHLFLVAVEGQEILGFIAGFVSRHVFNPEIICLAESLWWVKQAARGTTAGARLLAAFIEWGQANANWVTLTLEHHSPIKSTALLKRGFKLQESAYLLEVN